MIDVLLIDDHPIILDGLREAFIRDADVGNVDTADNVPDGIELVRANDYSVCLCDMRIPGSSGLDFVKIAKTEKTNLPVVILSMYPEEHYAVRAAKDGAAGYISKSEPTSVIIASAKKAASGEIMFSNSVMRDVMQMYRGEGVLSPHEQLSNREHEVFMRIARGRSVQEIADELNLGAKTVYTYRSRILQKLNVRANSSIVEYALAHELIDGSMG